MKIKVWLGALCNPIGQQIAEQGLRFEDENDAQRFQEMSDDLIRLKINGVLTASKMQKARTRMVKLIARAVTTDETGGDDE